MKTVFKLSVLILFSLLLYVSVIGHGDPADVTLKRLMLCVSLLEASAALCLDYLKQLTLCVSLLEASAALCLDYLKLLSLCVRTYPRYKLLSYIMIVRYQAACR